jgi:hypothetical protein
MFLFLDSSLWSSTRCIDVLPPYLHLPSCHFSIRFFCEHYSLWYDYVLRIEQKHEFCPQS